jgi:hypothetical protein
MSRFTDLFQQTTPKVSSEPQKDKEVVQEKPAATTLKQPVAYSKYSKI